MAWARMVAVVVPSPATVLVLLATSRTMRITVNKVDSGGDDLPNGDDYQVRR
jgi:hypothetical protein